MNKKIATHYAEGISGKTPTKPQAPTQGVQIKRFGKQHSIVPRSSVAGTALITVIAIMAFLASLTLGAVTLVNETAQGWQSDISREATIQIKQIDGVDIDQALTRARQIAGGYAGVTSVTVVDPQAMGRLLEPWLGSGLDLEQLPVPRLVTLTISDKNPPDLATMGERIEAEVKGASFDDHRAWVGRLTTMANATITIGVIVFMLMMMATILTVVFATRGAMSGNKHVIEVLHFVGAEQSYIAGQFQKHFLVLGLKGAVAGGLCAIICFLIVGFWTSNNIADPTAEQVAALFGTFSVGFWGYVGTTMLVLVLAVLTALTSRFTVLRHVGTLDRNTAQN